MAFALDAIVNNVVYSLSDKNPFRLGTVTGLSMATNHRLTERSPRQDGDTDTGYRLDPRTITLQLHFYAATQAALDGYRDMLMTIFKPARGYDIKLRITRDDGELRQLDCQTIGPVDVPLVIGQHAAKLHRVVVQLRAADPILYDPNVNYYDFYSVDNWWLADGAIGTAVVLEHVESPAYLQAWTWSGTVSDFTVAFRTGRVTAFTRFAWASFNPDIQYVRTASNTEYLADGNVTYLKGRIALNNYPNLMLTSAMPALEENYFYVRNNGTITFYMGTIAQGSFVGTIDLAGSAGVWRGLNDVSNYWTESIPLGAIYGTALDSTQLGALHGRMGSVAINYGSAFIDYGGGAEESPVIALTGSLVSPKIINNFAAGTLDFTGSTIPPGDTWTVDLREKTIVDSSGSIPAGLIFDIDFPDWTLAPGASETQYIQVTAGSVGADARVTINYYERYKGY